MMIHVQRFVIGALAIAIVGACGWFVIAFPLGFVVVLFVVLAYAIGHELTGGGRDAVDPWSEHLPPPPPPERD